MPKFVGNPKLKDPYLVGGVWKVWGASAACGAAQVTLDFFRAQLWGLGPL